VSAPAPTAGTEEPLHVKYRPKTLADVRGQDATVKSLKKVLSAATRPHAYLFTGPSGCGKTTLARIVASHAGVLPSNVAEADAATNNGIDSMREITGGLRYQGFGEQPNKFVIIDECHALSKAAWQALLKTLEEPPAHVYFALCTTEPGKVPDTIRTRCAAYDLKPVRADDIVELLEEVCTAEKFDTPDKHLSHIARACGGSPRQALMMLAMGHSCETTEELLVLLEQPLENKELIDLCRALVGGQLTWPKLTATLKAMEEVNPESVRIVTVNYLGSCLMGAKTDEQAERLLHMLHPFLKPFNASDKVAPLLAAFGDVLYA
jgi:DNA polymerase-3 subunit gamma/tau